MDHHEVRLGELMKSSLSNLWKVLLNLHQNILTKNHQSVNEEFTSDLDQIAVSINEKLQTGPVIKIRDLVQKGLQTAKSNLENRGVAKCYRNTAPSNTSLAKMCW